VFHFTCRFTVAHGLLNYFDNAENGFVSAGTILINDYFDILVQYQAIADLNEKIY
jgi:uracil phosphoribosyltransferase